MSIVPSASIATCLTTEEGDCVLTYDPLDTNKIIKSVGDHSAGAIAVFIGTTRNSFNGPFSFKHTYSILIRSVN